MTNPDRGQRGLRRRAVYLPSRSPRSPDDAMASPDLARPDDPGPHARVVALQDALYDLVLTSVARPCAAEQLPRLRRDAQHAAALAEQLADAALQLSATGDAHLDPE